MDKLKQSWGPVTYVKRKGPYNQELLFPAGGNSLAGLVCALAGTKTLTATSLKVLAAYGIETKPSSDVADYLE